MSNGARFRPPAGPVHAGVLMRRPGQPAERSLVVTVAGALIASVAPHSDTVAGPAAPATGTGNGVDTNAGTGTGAAIGTVAGSGGTRIGEGLIGGVGSLVLSALADAHDHGRGLPTIAFGAPDQALESWLPALAGQPHIDSAVLTALALAKLARSGVGSVVHCHNTQKADELAEECAAAAGAARDIGLRMAVAVPLIDRNRLGYGPDESVLSCIDPAHRAGIATAWAVDPRPFRDQIARFEEVASAVAGTARCDEPDLVNVQYCPVGPQWCSDDLLEAVAAASATTGRRVHMHLFETRYQREWAQAHYPGGLLRHLDEIGLLSERLTVAHGVWLDEAEIDLLAERRVVVSVNTSSNLRLRSGRAAVASMIGAGVRVAFGLDGMSLDDDEDALRELQLTHLLHAGVGFDETLSAGDILAASTATGPVAVSGDGRWGQLEPGAPADLVVIDHDALVADVVDPAGLDDAALVLARARSRHVTDLVVAGRVVVRDGVVLGTDLAALETEVADRCRAARPALVAMGPAVAAYQAGLRRFYAENGHRAGAGAAHGGAVEEGSRP